MVNEIDGYKALTESQRSRPLPACWMVKEIARYGGAQVQLASNLIHHRASSKGSASRGARVPLASNLVHHRASSKGSAGPSRQLPVDAVDDRQPVLCRRDDDRLERGHGQRLGVGQRRQQRGRDVEQPVAIERGQQRHEDDVLRL